MAWLRTDAGKEMQRPSAEDGIYIEGPLSVADLKAIIEALVEEVAAQAVVETRRG